MTIARMNRTLAVAIFGCVIGAGGAGAGAGAAPGAKTIAMVASIYDDKLPVEAIGETLQPLLRDIFAATGRGPVPGDLAQGVGAGSEFRPETPLGPASAG